MNECLARLRLKNTKANKEKKVNKVAFIYTWKDNKTMECEEHWRGCRKEGGGKNVQYTYMD